MARNNVKHSDFKAQLLEDPEVRREYEALEPEYRLRRDIIMRRNQMNLSQTKLAEIIGTKQPALSRLERGDGNVTLVTLRRIADALGTDLDISLKTRSKTKIIA